ncbi:MAG: homocysteine S-methyltransferase family protein, partial [Coriobacteriia bacterium]|nr:homocysteine S-methyltransferase family protein [Coriobacteriia bacterium]
ATTAGNGGRQRLGSRPGLAACNCGRQRRPAQALMLEEEYVADIALRFHKDIVVLDGALGTVLLAQGVDAETHPMLLNVVEPELISSIHQRYLLAGAQALTTNSFAGSRPQLAAFRLDDRLEELNRIAVRLAKDCKPEHVLADIGPCGLLLPPFGTASFDEVLSTYAEQAKALAAEEPDAILIETMIDIADARCALMAVKLVCDLPVFVSLSFAEGGRMGLSGTDAAAAAVILEAAGADVIGLNCGLGPEAQLPLLRQMALATDLPLLIQPNTGMPQLGADGSVSYDSNPDAFAEAAWAFRQEGAQFIGSCCGSTPAFTAAIYAAVGELDVLAASASGSQADEQQADGQQASGRQARRYLTLASSTSTVQIKPDAPCVVIGERINTTGKPELAASLERRDYSLATQLCIEQDEAGAELIDVNIGTGNKEASEVFAALVSELSQLSRCPLVFDNLNGEALENALRIYPGRALINSVSGSQSRQARILPLAKRYGAAVIAMCIDGNKLPESVAERLAIAEQIQAAALEYGLSEDDLIYDVLSLAAISDEAAAQVTLDSIRALTERGMLTVIGLSNASYKLPEPSRLNAELLSRAIDSGLSAVILNPNDELVMATLAETNARRLGS